MTPAPRSTAVVRRGTWRVAAALLLAAAATGALAASAGAEQATQPGSAAAGQTTTGRYHSCALTGGQVHCWGYGGNGQLGYGNTRSIGDNEVPRAAGPVDLGAGRTATAISAGDVHTCALLDNGTVRCWGFGANGRLGYGNTQAVGDNETPGSVGPVDLGPGRTAKAISAGDGHTCAILDNDLIRCWGYGFDGRLGYNTVIDPTDSDPSDGTALNIGDNETPAAMGPIDFGALDTAKAVSAGNAHTCAILTDDTLRCWGYGGAGRLGYGDAACLPIPPGETIEGSSVCPSDVGRGCWQILHMQRPATCDANPAAPSTFNMGPVDVGAGRTAKAVAAGKFHTCAVLDDGNVRCWGTGGSGRLGYGNESTVGDQQTPASAGPVNLGAGRTAKAITAGGAHTCAILDTGGVRCWGAGGFGQLGYGSFESVGLTNLPGEVGPVNLGTGRSAQAITAGEDHTCARLDDGTVRCWGRAANGRLGLCSPRNVGDNEAPGSVGPVDLGSGGARCPVAGGTRTGPLPGAGDYPVDPAVAQAARLQGLRSCLGRVSRHARSEVRRARRLSGRGRARAMRHARRHRLRLRRRCLERFGRTPGRVVDLGVRAVGRRRIVLTFKAPGTDGTRPPAARTYLIKQSLRPIRTRRDFSRAPSLCRGRCSFDIAKVGARLEQVVTGLRRGTVYYFAVRARDNVSKRTGPRSRTVSARAR